MHVDVDDWARQQRDVLIAMFHRFGAFPSGAMLLARKDPGHLKELDQPMTFEQAKSDYPNSELFTQALRIHCEKLAGLAVVVYGEMIVTPHTGTPSRTFFMSLARRGYMNSTVWTARIEMNGTRPALGALEEEIFLDLDPLFPVTN